MSREYRQQLRDIAAAAGKIRAYVRGMSYEDFLEDSKTQDAVIRNLEIIGEAARGVPASIRDRTRGIAWQELIGFRNILIHEYFGVNLAIVWDAIAGDIDDLESACGEILEGLS